MSRVRANLRLALTALVAAAGLLCALRAGSASTLSRPASGPAPAARACCTLGCDCCAPPQTAQAASGPIEVSDLVPAVQSRPTSEPSCECRPADPAAPGPK